MGLVGVSACGSATDSTIGGEMGGYGGYVDGGDFRSKVWSISGGPKYRRRNSAFSDVFLICVPVAMKFAHLEVFYLFLSLVLNFIFRPIFVW
ncbi:hypothetical protein SOVF_178550 isoform A [Spinacia oleracea]|nr:hypothetical protein SOVF_178550 isoform A [Spinacia oleracea]